MDIYQAHPNKKGCATDVYYVKLGNRLIDAFDRLRLDFGEPTSSIFRYAALLLSNYMEDIVADSGQWRSFSTLSQQMFGYPVPMYHNDTANYYPDEPSLDAVRFLIWHAAIEMDDAWWDASNPDLLKMATVAYDILDQAFEQLPINDELSDDITLLITKAGNDFLKMRPALIWLLKDCYLTRSFSAEELLEKQLDEVVRNNILPEESMQLFYVLMNSIFTYKIGPFALYAKNYLSALMRSRSMLKEAQEVEDIENMLSATYKYTIEEGGKWLRLQNTNGQVLMVDRNEITLDDNKLRSYDGCHANFVKYLGKWNLNGILIPLEDVSKNWDGFVKNAPDFKPEGVVDMPTEKLLEMTGGREIIYFADKKGLENYLVDNMHYSLKHLDFLNNQNAQGGRPLLFIDKESEKYAIHISFGFVPCIADPANPYYDAKIARKEMMEMFWSYHSVSTATMLYLLNHDFLPDIYSDSLFCSSSSLEQKRADALFLLRYVRKEHY